MIAMLPEIVLFDDRYFVLRGLQWNDHASRYELVYEQTTIYGEEN